MSVNGKTVDIRAWSPAAGTEPAIRIGVVLEGDGDAVVRLRAPDVPCTARCDEHPAFELAPGTQLDLHKADTGIAMRGTDTPPCACGTIRLTPATRRPLSRGTGMTVRGVVAGRGFHWQKRADITLPGALEVHSSAGGLIVVNVVPLEDYLAGVITAEMSGACPLEFLKAQCVVARSWLLAMTEAKHEGTPFDRCNDDCCQRYQGTGDLSDTALHAVRDTRGRVLLTPDGGVLDANYAKSCGGISEEPRYVWGYDKPGLTAIVDAPPDAPEHRFFPITDADLDEYLRGDWLRQARAYCSPHVVPVDAIGQYLGRVDEVDDYFRWRVRHTGAQLVELLREKRPELRGLVTLHDLRVVRRGVSGRVARLEICGAGGDGKTIQAVLPSEYAIRAALHPRFLYSSAFAADVERDAAGHIAAVALRGAGWGHGAGLCQIGALGMALTGRDCDTICTHYYPEAHLATVYA